MTRLKLLIASLFAIALATGIVVGMGVSKASPRAHDQRSWLAEELNLTPAQSEDMRNIWSDVSRPGGADRRRLFQKERDDAVQGLLTEDQKTSYLKIADKYNEEMAEYNHERDQAFQAAVENTKAILTDAQRARYDELLKSGFRGSPRDRADSWHGASTRRGPGGGATTLESAPATGPAPPH